MAVFLATQLEILRGGREKSFRALKNPSKLHFVLSSSKVNECKLLIHILSKEVKGM